MGRTQLVNETRIGQLGFPLAALFVCDCVARVVPVYLRRYPSDDRLGLAIAAQREFCRGERSGADLAKARDEVRAAAWACTRQTKAAVAVKSVTLAATVIFDPPWNAYFEATRLAQQAGGPEEPRWQASQLAWWLDLKIRPPIQPLLKTYRSDADRQTLSIVWDAMIELGYHPVTPTAPALDAHRYT